MSDERLLAAQLFNETWRLLDQAGRTAADDDRMIHAAHASRWALARASAVAGDAAAAREHTDQALAALGGIAEGEDRDLVLADLETIPGQPRYWQAVSHPNTKPESASCLE